MIIELEGSFEGSQVEKPSKRNAALQDFVMHTVRIYYHKIFSYKNILITFIGI